MIMIIFTVYLKFCQLSIQLSLCADQHLCTLFLQIST